MPKFCALICRNLPCPQKFLATRLLLCALVNPFDQAEKERLCNMATGKTASVDTELFLLTVNYRGEIPKNNFISKCIKKPERFDENIAK